MRIPHLISVHGVAHFVLLITVLICGRDDGRSLLGRTTAICVLVAEGCIVDLLILRRVVPNIRGIEGLKRHQRCDTTIL